MYLLALLTKWRNKGIRFVVSYPLLDRFELTAEIMSKGKYVSIISDDLEYACKCVDGGLTRIMGVEKGNDNNYANS